MSFKDSDNRYNFSLTPADEDAQRQQDDTQTRILREQEEKHASDLRLMKRSLLKTIAVFCVITLILGIGGGALIGTLVSRNNANIASTAPITETSPYSTTTAAPTDTSSAAATTAAPESTAAQSSMTTAAIGNLYATTSGATVEMETSDVYDLVSPTVVSIATEYQTSAGYYRQSKTASGSGSGVLLSQDGYIVTNNHVIEKAMKISVVLSTGDEYEAKLIGTDDITDVALLKIEGTNLPYAIVGNSDNMRIGDTAIVIGNPLGRLSGTLTSGVISGLDRSITMSDGTTMNLVQMDAAVNPGNSGGGLFNNRGELVGIVVAKTTATEVEGLGFAIPVNDTLPILDELMTHGYVTGRPALGITVMTISDMMTAMMYRVNYLGVYVTSVAVENGLEVGDCLLTINGAEIRSTADITAALQNLTAGDKVEIEVYRGNAKTTVEVTLVEESMLNQQ